jgi:hypothetical protein
VKGDSLQECENHSDVVYYLRELLKSQSGSQVEVGFPESYEIDSYFLLRLPNGQQISVEITDHEEDVWD